MSRPIGTRDRTARSSEEAKRPLGSADARRFDTLLSGLMGGQGRPMRDASSAPGAGQDREQPAGRWRDALEALTRNESPRGRPARSGAGLVPPQMAQDPAAAAEAPAAATGDAAEDGLVEKTGTGKPGQDRRQPPDDAPRTEVGALVAAASTTMVRGPQQAKKAGEGAASRLGEATRSARAGTAARAKEAEVIRRLLESDPSADGAKTPEAPPPADSASAVTGDASSPQAGRPGPIENAPLAPAQHASAPRTSAPQAASAPPPAAPATPPNADGLTQGLVAPHAARLTIGSGPEEVEVRLRVRHGVADVQLSGPDTSGFVLRTHELRAALADAGVELGRFDLGDQGAEDRGRREQGEPDGHPRRQERRPERFRRSSAPSSRLTGRHVDA